MKLKLFLLAALGALLCSIPGPVGLQHALVAVVGLTAITSLSAALHGNSYVLGIFSETSLNAYVKRTYDDKYVENSLIQESDSTIKNIKRETDGSGDNFSWLADVDDVDGGSPDFTIAQGAAAAQSATVGSRFQAEWFAYSDVAQITEAIIGKTRNNDGAWQQAVKTAMAKKMRAITHANAVAFQSKGWGEISQITNVSGSSFKPLVASDITKYIRGMPIHFSSTLNTAVLRSATVLYVTAVSYTVGSELVTLSGTLASVSAVNNDWAFRAGARQNSATPTRLSPAGLGAFFPNQLTDLSDATITTLYGPDRSLNSRLYGTFIDATGGGSVISALQDACQEALTVGNAKKLELYASKAVFAQVAKDMNNPVVFEGNPGTKSIGTRRLLVYTDGDSQDAHLQVSRTTNDNQIWGYDPTQISMKSISGAPHISTADGLTMCRQAAAAGYEVRWFQQMLYKFANPAGGVRIQLV
jgi:hypothetical protein